MLEYNPFKTAIEEIDKALAEESALNPAVMVPACAVLLDDDQDQEPEAASGSAVSAGVAATDSAEIPDEWEQYVGRYLEKHCHLIVEAKMTQSQLQTAIGQVTLGNVRGGAGGNVILYLDCNLWGEAITSPRVRRPPVSKAQLQKIWKAVAAARQEPDQVGLLPTGDVLVVVDGGRQDESLLNHLGMGSSRRRHDASRSRKEGKVIYRAVTLFFEEKSVKARKYRRRARHDVVNCTQRAHIFYSALTKVQERQQKHFSELCNMLGKHATHARQPEEAILGRVAESSGRAL